ncbi:MAG: ribbon-helix-helix protein, CopG family [Luteolibacter sp.]
MRTIIDLPESQLGELSEYCHELGISRAEAVRRAVAQLLERREKNSRHTAFGAWKSKKLDVPNFIREMREEWDS